MIRLRVSFDWAPEVRWEAYQSLRGGDASWNGWPNVYVAKRTLLAMARRLEVEALYGCDESVQDWRDIAALQDSGEELCYIGGGAALPWPEAVCCMGKWVDYSEVDAYVEDQCNAI